MMETDSKSSSDLSHSYEPLLEASGPIRVAKNTKLSNDSYQKSFNILSSLYILITAPLLLWQLRSQPLRPYTPVNDVLSYQRQPLYFGEDLSFAGAPEDVEENWRYLLEPVNIKLTKDELQRAHAEFTEDIVQVTDGDYVSVLSVYHELHCLNTLRMNMHHDHYYPNMTADDEKYNMDHMTHCVDTIRRSLMCKADVALYSAYWIGDHSAFPNKELRSKSDTVCVNWQAIDDWSRERLLPRDKYKVRPGPFENVSIGS